MEVASDMLRFIALHPLAFQEDQLAPLAKEPLPAGVTWTSTFIAFADGKSFCLWEAPTREAVIDIFTRYEIPFENLYEVRQFDPVTGTLEPEPAKTPVLQSV
jgi:hypothetical protein